MANKHSLLASAAPITQSAELKTVLGATLNKALACTEFAALQGLTEIQHFLFFFITVSLRNTRYVTCVTQIKI